MSGLENFEAAFHAAQLRDMRETLERSICICCKLNGFQCRCSNEDLNTYLREHPMKVRYPR